MKNYLILSISILLLFSCGKSVEMETHFIPSMQPKELAIDFYAKGETIEYSGKIGVFNAADIKILVDTSSKLISGKNCREVTLSGKLAGTADWFTNVDDQFISYINLENDKPHLFIRNLKENKYKLLEYNLFNHEKSTVKVTNKTTIYKDSVKTYPTSIFINDPITAYFQLRKLDFSKYKTNDTIALDVFLEKESFNLKVVYLGKEKVKSKIGKRNCIVVTPLIPDNQILVGKTPVKAWISDDEDRIPLRISSKTWLGGLDVDITSYKKL